MIILIAPAKRMSADIPYLNPETIPIFLEQTNIIMQSVKQKSLVELMAILECSEHIAKEAYMQYQTMDVQLQDGVPALLAYQGIQYTYMAPHVFPDEYLRYVQMHVRILSGFYGLLRPLDNVVPYRLELNHIVAVDTYKNLYEFWNDQLYQAIVKEDTCILNLASKQYSRIIKRYCKPEIQYVTCYFKEDEQGCLREKGVYVKMARGEMVRYLAEIEATSFNDVKGFSRLGYRFCDACSDDQSFVFIRKKQVKSRK